MTFIECADYYSLLRELRERGIDACEIRLRAPSIIPIPVSDLNYALYATTAAISGKPKAAWAMKLKREPGKSMLPRGYGRHSGKKI